MSDKNDVTLGEIEKTQAALRESIEQAKDLAAQSERLIKKHRKEIERGGVVRATAPARLRPSFAPPRRCLDAGFLARLRRSWNVAGDESETPQQLPEGSNATRFRCAALCGASFAASPARADHPIAGGNVAGSGPVLTIGAETLPAGALSGDLQASVTVPDAYTDAQLIAFAARHVHAHTTDYTTRAAASLAYGITGHPPVSANLPFIYRDDPRAGHHSHVGGASLNTVEQLGRVSGVGDLPLMTQYLLAHDHEQAGGYRHLAA